MSSVATNWKILLMPNNTDTPVVYIVDDDDSVRKGLSRLMQSAGLKSQSFSSAEKFLAKVDDHQRGCILLDITMPRMTGLQLQAELKKHGIDLPVIAVSARDDANTREMARELGAAFFFRKPVDDQALLDAIKWVSASDGQNPGLQ
jgi:FixJ family two-component response regulator